MPGLGAAPRPASPRRAGGRATRCGRGSPSALANSASASSSWNTGLSGNPRSSRGQLLGQLPLVAHRAARRQLLEVQLRAVGRGRPQDQGVDLLLLRLLAAVRDPVQVVHVPGGVQQVTSSGVGRPASAAASCLFGGPLVGRLELRQPGIDGQEERRGEPAAGDGQRRSRSPSASATRPAFAGDDRPQGVVPGRRVLLASARPASRVRSASASSPADQPAGGRRRGRRRRRGPAAALSSGLAASAAPAAPAPRRPGRCRCDQLGQGARAPAGRPGCGPAAPGRPARRRPACRLRPAARTARGPGPAQSGASSAARRHSGVRVGRRGRPARRRGAGRRSSTSVSRSSRCGSSARVGGVLAHPVQDHRPARRARSAGQPGRVRRQPRLVRRPVAVGGLVVVAALAATGPPAGGTAGRRPAGRTAYGTAAGRPARPGSGSRGRGSSPAGRPGAGAAFADARQQLLGPAERGGQRPVAAEFATELPQAGEQSARR